jgi:7-cyano-7-deazaguanine synthase
MATAVCLVSGGLDSCVAAASARAQGYGLAFQHVSYGQLTEGRELRAFHEIADFFAVDRRLVVAADHLRLIGGSALTDRALVLPEGDLSRPGIPTSYVPFRNAGLLAAATSWAEIIGASYIFIGAVEEDSSGYPDCRQAFFDAFGKVIQEGTRPETSIEIMTPLIHMSKREIVALGVQLGAPFERTWSCYQSEELACGRCDSCLLRLHGFMEAGVTDPIPYAR